MHLSIYQHWVKIERFLYKYFQMQIMGVGWCKLYCDYELTPGGAQEEHSQHQMNNILHISSYIFIFYHILTSRSTSWSHHIQEVEKQTKSKWFDSLPHHSFRSLTSRSWEQDSPQTRVRQISSHSEQRGIMWHRVASWAHKSEKKKFNVSKVSKVSKVQISTKLRQDGCIIYITIKFQCQRPGQG